MFGRKKIVDEIKLTHPDISNILEIGCGTGYNLINLAKKYPHGSVTGIDLSKEMLEVAVHQLNRNKLNVTIINEPYSKDRFENKFNLILCSYSLSMMGQHTSEIIQAAADDLIEGGIFAAVDFHRSKFSFFTKHMIKHHVQMDGNLLTQLKTIFPNHKIKVRNAYLGIWQYFTFIGNKS